MKGVLVFLLLVAVALAEVPVCVPSPDVELIGNPDDCSTYYMCDEYTPILNKCDIGLWFNPAVGVCDFPENVPEGVCTPPGPAVCVPSPDVILFGNPEDCSTYFICDEYTPILNECDDGLWFNPAVLVCDYPENVQEGVCIPPGIKTTQGRNGY